jgi:hypothetical protein
MESVSNKVSHDESEYAQSIIQNPLPRWSEADPFQALHHMMVVLRFKLYIIAWWMMTKTLPKQQPLCDADMDRLHMFCAVVDSDLRSFKSEHWKKKLSFEAHCAFISNVDYFEFSCHQFLGLLGWFEGQKLFTKLQEYTLMAQAHLAAAFLTLGWNFILPHRQKDLMAQAADSYRALFEQQQ